MALAAGVLGAPAAPLVGAAGKPNFRGEWKANPEKSDFGPMPTRPEKIVHKIEHKDPEIKMSTVQVIEASEVKLEYTMTTDGKEFIQKSAQGDAKATAKWDGNALVVSTKRETQGIELNITATWTLSDDGKVWTNSTIVNTSVGGFNIKAVCENQ